MIQEGGIMEEDMGALETFNQIAAMMGWAMMVAFLMWLFVCFMGLAYEGAVKAVSKVRRNK
jgi:hypothetical protein